MLEFRLGLVDTWRSFRLELQPDWVSFRLGLLPDGSTESVRLYQLDERRSARIEYLNEADNDDPQLLVKLDGKLLPVTRRQEEDGRWFWEFDSLRDGIYYVTLFNDLGRVIVQQALPLNGHVIKLLSAWREHDLEYQIISEAHELLTGLHLGALAHWQLRQYAEADELFAWLMDFPSLYPVPCYD